MSLTSRLLDVASKPPNVTAIVLGAFGIGLMFLLSEIASVVLPLFLRNPQIASVDQILPFPDYSKGECGRLEKQHLGRATLLLGNAAAARDHSLLKSKGVTHVINAAVTEGILSKGPFTYLEIALFDRRDSAAAMAEAWEKQTGPFIDKAIKEGGCVFVHCFMGASRSTSIVMHYLMRYHGMHVRGALLHLLWTRFRFNNKLAPPTHPNQGFFRELEKIDAQCYTTEDCLRLDLIEYTQEYGTGFLPEGPVKTRQEVVYNDGSAYLGDMLCGVRHGTGVLTKKGGSKIEGEFMFDRHISKVSDAS